MILLLYMITDWDDLIDCVSTIPHKVTLEYPDPFPSDLWIVEARYFRTKAVEQARGLQVSVLVIGGNVAIRDRLAYLGIDFLVGSEFDPDDMIQWIDQCKNRPKLQKSLRSGKSIAFAGLLPTGGGVGKDTIVGNTGAYLSSLGKRVIVVDLDSFGTLKERFKVETNFSIDLWPERFMNIPLTLDRIRESMPKTHLKFHLMPASINGNVQSEETLTHLHAWLTQAYDIVLWNLGSGTASRQFFTTLQHSNEVFLIGFGDRAKFAKCASTYEEYKSRLSVIPRVILNRFYEKEAVFFFEKEFGIPVFASSLEDRRVFEITEQGSAISLEIPKHSFSLMIRQISEVVLDEPLDKMAIPEIKKEKINRFRLW